MVDTVGGVLTHKSQHVLPQEGGLVIPIIKKTECQRRSYLPSLTGRKWQSQDPNSGRTTKLHWRDICRNTLGEPGSPAEPGGKHFEQLLLAHHPGTQVRSAEPHSEACRHQGSPCLCPRPKVKQDQDCPGHRGSLAGRCQTQPLHGSPSRGPPTSSMLQDTSLPPHVAPVLLAGGPWTQQQDALSANLANSHHLHALSSILSQNLISMVQT